MSYTDLSDEPCTLPHRLRHLPLPNYRVYTNRLTSPQTPLRVGAGLESELPWREGVEG